MRRRALIAASALALLACEGEAAPRPRGEPPPSPEVELVPRTPFVATYPCAEQCHDERNPDPRPRVLTEFHAGRTVEHGPALTWCASCHALDAPDELALLDGARVPFDASDRICAQCHGEKHRDWSNGLHGLSTGGWTGTVQRRTCTACHDPHAPGRIRLEALPPPEPDPRSHTGRGA